MIQSLDNSANRFIGIVEDVEDPLQLGRVRVRIIGKYEDIDTSQLNWAHVILPTTSASVDGVGETPALVVGSRVLGFFLDQMEQQQPMITGVFPVIPDRDENRHSLSWLARGKNTIEKDKIGPEPDSSYAAQYPFNQVTVSKTGHVIEIDDTPENERIHIYHNSGSYIEINSEGGFIIKATGDNYVLAGGDQQVHIEGDQKVTIRGEQKVNIEGNQTIKVGGKVTIDCSSVTMTGDVKINGDLSVDGTVTGGKVRTTGGKDLDTHKHTGVRTGSSISGPPQ